MPCISFCPPLPRSHGYPSLGIRDPGAVLLAFSENTQHGHYLMHDSLKNQPPKCWELESSNSWMPFSISYMAFCLLLIDSIMVTHFPRGEKAYVVWMPASRMKHKYWFFLSKLRKLVHLFSCTSSFGFISLSYCHGDLLHRKGLIDKGCMYKLSSWWDIGLFDQVAVMSLFSLGVIIHIEDRWGHQFWNLSWV